MIFDLLPLPKATGDRDPKNCALACTILLNNTHTKSGWILEKKNTPPQPPHTLYPEVPPLGHDPGNQIKIPSDMFYIFHLWEDTQSYKVWFKKLWNWLCNWNLMIFSYIWPFGPSPGPQGPGPKTNVLLHAPFMWAFHTPNLVGFGSMV